MESEKKLLRCFVHNNHRFWTIIKFFLPIIVYIQRNVPDSETIQWLKMIKEADFKSREEPKRVGKLVGVSKYQGPAGSQMVFGYLHPLSEWTISLEHARMWMECMPMGINWQSFLTPTCITLWHRLLVEMMEAKWLGILKGLDQNARKCIGENPPCLFTLLQLRRIRRLFYCPMWWNQTHFPPPHI